MLSELGGLVTGLVEGAYEALEVHRAECAPVRPPTLIDARSQRVPRRRVGQGKEWAPFLPGHQAFEFVFAEQLLGLQSGHVSPTGLLYYGDRRRRRPFDQLFRGMFQVSSGGSMLPSNRSIESHTVRPAWVSANKPATKGQPDGPSKCLRRPPGGGAGAGVAVPRTAIIALSGPVEGEESRLSPRRSAGQKGFERVQGLSCVRACLRATRLRQPPARHSRHGAVSRGSSGVQDASFGRGAGPPIALCDWYAILTALAVALPDQLPRVHALRVTSEPPNGACRPCLSCSPILTYRLHSFRSTGHSRLLAWPTAPGCRSISDALHLRDRRIARRTRRTFT